jgi:hypothetical protein
MTSHSHASPTLLRVTAGSERTDVPSTIEIDEYVPLRWRTYDEPLGAGLVRLGNYTTTVMELVVEPHSQVVRGATVTSIDELSPWPDFSVSVTFAALPALSTSFEGWQVIDLKEEFEVAVREGQMVVHWGELGICDGYRSGPVQLLVRDHFLRGLWFSGLTAEQTAVLVSHARQRQ